MSRCRAAAAWFPLNFRKALTLSTPAGVLRAAAEAISPEPVPDAAVRLSGSPKVLVVLDHLDGQMFHMRLCETVPALRLSHMSQGANGANQLNP